MDFDWLIGQLSPQTCLKIQWREQFVEHGRDRVQGLQTPWNTAGRVQHVVVGYFRMQWMVLLGKNHVQQGANCQGKIRPLLCGRGPLGGVGHLADPLDPPAPPIEYPGHHQCWGPLGGSERILSIEILLWSICPQCWPHSDWSTFEWFQTVQLPHCSSGSMSQYLCFCELQGFGQLLGFHVPPFLCCCACMQLLLLFKSLSVSATTVRRQRVGRISSGSVRIFFQWQPGAINRCFGINAFAHCQI